MRVYTKYWQSFSHIVKLFLWLVIGCIKYNHVTLTPPPLPHPSSPRWVFLFDKVMLVCHKRSRLRLVFEVRYSVKHVFPVNSLRVEPITNPTGRGGNFSQGFKLIVKGHGDFLAYAKTEELKSQWIDAINHARYV